MEGYEFVGWSRKLLPAFCGNSSAPCRLPTTGFAGNEPLLRVLESDRAFYLAPEFRYVADAGDQRAFYVGEAEDGSVSTVVHVGGAVLHADTDGAGALWTSLEFADGDRLVLKSDRTGLPEELHYSGFIFTFHEFTDEEVLVGVVPPAGEPVYGRIPLAGGFSQPVGEALGGRESIVVGSYPNAAMIPDAQRSLHGYSSPVADGATLFGTTESGAGGMQNASGELGRGVEALDLAMQVLSSRQLAPLVSQLTSDARSTLRDEITAQVRKRAQDNTPEQIQIRVWASSGKCLLTVLGTARTVILGKVDGCKDLVTDAHAALYNYAIDWKKQQERVLDQRLDVAGVEDPTIRFEQKVKEMLPADDLLDGYSVLFEFLDPDREGTVFPPGTPITLKVRADESDIRYPVECVQLEANARVRDRLCIWGRDERFLDDVIKFDRLPRGDVTLFLPALDEGDYTLRLTSLTLGQRRVSEEFKIVVARVDAPLTLETAGGGEYPSGQIGIGLTASVRNASGRELPGNLVQWLEGEKPLSRGGKLLLRNPADGAYTYTARVHHAGETYERSIQVVVGEAEGFCPDEARTCELEVSCLGCDVFWTLPVAGQRVQYRLRITQLPFTLQGEEYRSLPATLRFDSSRNFPGTTAGIRVEAL